MKKTLFTALLLGWCGIAPAVGDTVDVFVPQSVICVQQDETLTLSATLVAGSEAYISFFDKKRKKSVEKRTHFPFSLAEGNTSPPF